MRRCAALLLAGLLGGAGMARAQVAAALLATADVNTTPLTVSNPQGLVFGAVVAGTPATVDPRASANAAYFVIQGAKRAEISISFTLPGILRAGAGPHTMPLSFGATAACSRNTPNQATCTYFDPAAGRVDRIRNQNAPNNHYHVWLGGTVSPGATQQAGVYGATVTMTVVYTGN